MSDNTSTFAFLTNLGGGGEQIVAVERFSHRHISVGQEEGDDFSSSSHSRKLNVLMDLSWREYPQDRMLPKQTIIKRIVVPGAPYVAPLLLNMKLMIEETRRMWTYPELE